MPVARVCHEKQAWACSANGAGRTAAHDRFIKKAAMSLSRIHEKSATCPHVAGPYEACFVQKKVLSAERAYYEG